MSEFIDQLRVRKIASARRVLTWLEEHPDYPLPYEFSGDFTHFVYGNEDEQKTALAKFAFTFGTCEKIQPSTGRFGLRKDFGETGLRVLFDQEKTCTAKVVGRKLVRKPVYADPTYVEEWVDEVEYDCPASVLKGLDK